MTRVAQRRWTIKPQVKQWHDTANGPQIVPRHARQFRGRREVKRAYECPCTGWRSRVSASSIIRRSCGGGHVLYHKEAGGEAHTRGGIMGSFKDGDADRRCIILKRCDRRAGRTHLCRSEVFMSHMSPGRRHAVLLPPQAPGVEGRTWSPSPRAAANVQPAPAHPARRWLLPRAGTTHARVRSTSGQARRRHAMPCPCRHAGMPAQRP